MPQEKKKNNLFKLTNKKPITPSTKKIEENKHTRNDSKTHLTMPTNIEV